jgi:hypothetical protein
MCLNSKKPGRAQAVSGVRTCIPSSLRGFHASPSNQIGSPNAGYCSLWEPRRMCLSFRLMPDDHQPSRSSKFLFEGYQLVNQLILIRQAAHFDLFLRTQTAMSIEMLTYLAHSVRSHCWSLTFVSQCPSSTW